MIYDIVEKLKKEIESFKEETGQWEEIGRIMEIGDGIARISGLNRASSNEILLIETKNSEKRALAFNLEEDSIGALILEDSEQVAAGDIVKRTRQTLSIKAGNELLGRVIDPLGNPQDGQGPIFTAASRPVSVLLENRAPNVLEREPVSSPLHTGIKAIDSMIPIGRGQRELIIGDRQTGKTAIVLDTIINQRSKSQNEKPVFCIYVAIGQKESKIAKLVKTLKDFDALKYSVIVAASASAPAALWYLAPFAGCAIGEYFRDKGEDALVIYDDLSKHAWSYRQISLLLRRPPGREAYPGDIFYLHSRLLERAAKLSKEKGGGSLTALPIVETQLGDVTSYIPTNIISITDGQIYLESDLFYQGLRPAINVGLSVSRVGSAAQTKAMKKVAGRLRLTLAQFRELQAFIQFAADVDEVTQQRIREGEIMTEILKQEDLAPLPFEEQVAVLYAAANGYFRSFLPAEITKIESDFREYLKKFYDEEVLEPLRRTKDLTQIIENNLKEAISKFLENQESRNGLKK